MAPRRAAEPKPITGVALLVAVAVGGYAIWNDYPGIAALWAGLLVAAWTHPPAVFTGKKDARGYATPGDPGEQAAMSRYRYWADLKTRLIVPGADWLPGFKVQGTWIVAALAGFAAYWIPVHDQYTTVYGPWIDAAAAFLCVAVPAGAGRRNAAPDDTSPGTTVDALIALARKEPGKVAGLAAAGLGLGAVAGTVLSVFIPALLALAHRPGVPEAAIWTVSLVGGPLATLWKAWSREALEHWRLVVDAREEWAPRWTMLKQDPAPRLVDRRTVGAATVDTFDAPASAGSMTYLPMAAKITPTLGAGSRVAVLDVPNLDSKGQPVPGSRHPLRFEIADWPADQVPDLTDPATTKDEAELLARCSIAWFTEQLGCGRIILDDIALLTAPPAPAAEGADAEEVPEWAQESPSPAVWGMTWHAPQGPDAGYIRSIAGDMAGAFNAPVLVDHRGNGGAGVAYVGAYDPQYGPEWAPGAGVTDDAIQSLMDDAAWDSRWSDVMKQGANPPVRQGATAKTEALKDGTQINAVSFVTRLGMPPADFFPLEGKLPTVLNAAPFVAMTYFPAQGGGRAGERHAQAFTVMWADRPVPSKPEQVAPVPGSEGPKWALTAQVNQMFAAARLARPEVVRATALTRPESRQHIWKLDLRLYEGVTLAEVRGMAEKMRQNRGSEWLRVAQAPEGCVIYMGARPSRVKLARPDTALELERLDWQQILLDSGLSGIAGRMPVLKKVDHLPRNEQVKVLDFDLTGTGLEFTAFTGVRGKLEANSGNAWVQPRRVKNSSTDLQLLVCEVDPMPEKAGYDWGEIASSDVIPFATGVDGEPIAFNYRLDPHLLVAGASGGGKSVLMQSVLFGAIMRGYDVYVVDPTKGGADFKFAEAYARGFTGDIKEAAAMLKALYAEVVRRKNLNTEHGVGKYSDLPEHVRPAHVVIFLDEFTSLMGQDPVPPASDDPEMDEEREQILALNHARLQIGTYTGKIAREARSAGFTLVLATQKLAAKLLDSIPGAGDLKVNLSRILMGKATFGDKQSALRAPTEAPDLGDAIPPGRGLFETTAGSAMAIQAWYDPAEQGALAAKLSEAQIRVLSEDEKLSTAAPVKTSARRAPEAVELPELTLDAADLDLGELELTLDDLDAADGTDDDGAATPAQDVPGDEPAEQDNGPVVGTAVLYDVDGVIAPFTAAHGMERISAPGHGTVFYNPEIVARLAALDAHQAWLTNWDTDAPEAFGHLLPRALRVLPYGTEETGWWKIDALLAFAAENPGLRRVAWIDDSLAEVDPLLGVSFAEVAGDALADAGLECLLLAPDPHAGATAHDVARLEAFVAGLPDPGLAPAAAAHPHWLSALEAEEAVPAPAVDGAADARRHDDARAARDDRDDRGDEHDEQHEDGARAAREAAPSTADEFTPEPKPFVAPPAYDAADEFEPVVKRAVPVPAYTEDDPFA